MTRLLGSPAPALEEYQGPPAIQYSVVKGHVPGSWSVTKRTPEMDRPDILLGFPDIAGAVRYAEEEARFDGLLGISAVVVFAPEVEARRAA